MRTKESYRDSAIDHILEGQFAAVIKMEMLHTSGKYGFLDDYWDEDGDSIRVTSDGAFRFQDESLVTTTFPKGTDPGTVARVLRKFVDILESPDGHDVVNMGLEEGDLDYAQYNQDGEFCVFNWAEAIEDYKRRLKEAEEAAEIGTRSPSSDRPD